MRPLAELVAALRQRQIVLWKEDEDLCYRAPKGALDAVLLAELRERKAEVLAFLTDAAPKFREPPPEIQPVAREGALPLSFAQERLWFLDQLEPGNPFYNVPLALCLRGRLAVAALQASLNEIVQRHEVLRTTFPAVDGLARQVIAPQLEIPINRVELQAQATAEIYAEVERLALREAQRPFDLREDALLRATLLQLGAQEWVLLLTMHHIISDGWSMGIFIQELGDLYRSAVEGRPATLPKLSIQYADFAHWERQRFEEGALQAQLDYWTRQLEDATSELQLPTDRTRPPAQSFRGSSEQFEIEPVLSAHLQDLSRRSGATLFMTLSAALVTLLYRYSEQEDMLLGAPIANRNRGETEALLGFFVNTLVLRADLSGDPSFMAVLHQMKRTALDAYANQDLPFEKLVDVLQPERDLSRNPLFQMMFALQNAPLRPLALPGLEVSLLEMQRVTALFDLVLDMWELDGGLVGVLEYNTDLFDRATIVGMIGHFKTLLAAIAAAPEQRLTELPLLTETEQRQLLQDFNAACGDYPIHAPLHQLFEEQVAAGPARSAAVHRETRITYAALNARANQIAHLLRRVGVQRNDFVAILDERGIDFLAAILGILKAGGAYLPIDPIYPDERVRYMVSDSGVHTLITRTTLFEQAFGVTGQGLADTQLRHVLCLGGAPPPTTPEVRCYTAADLAREADTNPMRVNSSADRAYMLYTSGSTGLPKGAIVRHDGAVNHIYAEFDLLAFHADTAFLQSAPSSSDISVWQFLGPLLIGARVVIADLETVADPAALFDLIKTARVTLIELVPVVYQELLETVSTLPEAERILPDLEWAMVTGEAAPVGLVNRWLEAYAYIPIVNAYGPTEAADDVCQYVLSTPLAAAQRSVPIGAPLPNVKLFVLDRRLRLVPVGVAGEICVAGIGVGEGYWQNPEQTQANFVPNPYASDAHDQVLYRTGDMGRWAPDGNLEFLERIDQQVKIRGFRIDLGEIESLLSRHPAVQQNAVVVREAEPGEQQLAAYIVPDQTAENVSAQREQLQSEQIALWRALHENSYSEALLLDDDPTLNVIGWDSNYTGRPLPAADLQEYIDFTVERVLALQPRRVLEIGCGTGLLAFRLIPQLEHYWGTDLSGEAIRQLQALQVAKGGLRNTEFIVRAADDFSGLAEQRFDVAILPSVVQYFPSIDYLVRVLQGLMCVLPPDGAIFLGDVRNRQLLEAFHASVQVYKAESNLSPAELRQQVQQQLAQQQELAIDPGFFVALQQRFAEIAHVQVLPKRGFHHNEMTRFRYDVLIRLGAASGSKEPLAWQDWQERQPNVPEIRAYLTKAVPESFALQGVANARVQREEQLLQGLLEGAAFDSVGQLQAALAQQPPAGLEPEDLWALGRELPYQVEISMATAAAKDRFDVVFLRRAGGVQVQMAAGPSLGHNGAAPLPWSQYANNPLQEKLAGSLVPALRSHLKKHLPAHMLPHDFVLLTALPLTPNGKVDRAALPAPDRSRRRLAQNFVSPRTPVEQALAVIWATLLGLEEVGVHDDFFDLGGHSLKATQVMSRLHKQLDVDLPLRTIFSHPTVAGLAAQVDVNETSPYVAIEPIAAADHYALSHAQRRLWVLAQMEGGSAAYNMPGALLLAGQLDPAALEQAFVALAQRHESLRTTFALLDGELRQIVHAAPNFGLRYVDLTPHAEPSAQARTLADEDAVRPFDLQSGPLFRASLLKLDGEQHVLLFNIHHIIADGWSETVLVRELIRLYESIRGAVPAALPSLHIQYRDYASWQNNFLDSPDIAPHRDYWLAKLGGRLPVLDLATDFPRPPVKTFNGRTHSLQFDAARSEQLHALARRGEASLFMVLVTVVKALLYRYTGQEDILVGSPIAGREQADLEDQIGFFVNTLVLRDQVDGSASFEVLLAQVKQTATEAYDHQVYPFDKLVNELDVVRDVSRAPLLDTMVVFQNVEAPDFALAGLSVKPFPQTERLSKFDLSFACEEKDAGLHIDLIYNPDLFSPARIVRMGQHFLTLLDSILADARQPVDHLKLLPSQERAQLLAFSNSRHTEATTASFPPDTTLVSLFEAQVVRTPDAVALVYDGQQMTYNSLNAQANRLARHLRALGVGRNTLVGLFVERSPQLVVAILGILKAGGAYVPFDSDAPRERLAFMLADTQAPVLVTQSALVARLPEQRAALVLLDEEHDRADTNPTCDVRPDDRAYVIYTSGSTGKPKGVLVSHANVVRLFAQTQHWFQFDARDVWTLFHSYAFDFSVWELWGALLYGGRLVVVPYWVSRAPQAFYDLLHRERVTILNQTPSAFQQLVQVEADARRVQALQLRKVIFGGEALKLQRLRPWFARHGDQHPQLVNMYGITETTVHVTYRPLTRADLDAPGSMIGVPIPDLQLYILDARLQPAPFGVAGEIYVGGAGVSQGYLSRPELTAARFVAPPPWMEVAGLLYRTGDLACYLPDGDIEYLGRIDNQVKIRGFRIELSEIEANLAEHPIVEAAAVVVRQDSPTSKRLVAYIIPKPDTQLTIDNSQSPIANYQLPIPKLREFLQSKLPPYMLPAMFIPLDAFPLTANGKLDRQALPAPEQVRPELAQDFVRPHSEVERAIAVIWRQVLHLEQVGLLDNFFDLGGDSLSIVQVHDRLQEDLDQAVAVVKLFQYPTIRALAQFLSQAAEQQQSAMAQIEDRVQQQKAARRRRSHE